VSHFWSGKHKRTVKGINLITLYYIDVTDTSYPVNFRFSTSRRAKPRTSISVRWWQKCKRGVPNLGSDNLSNQRDYEDGTTRSARV